jgi:hypothetical protein
MTDQSTPTLEALQERARELNIRGRTTMSRDDLVAHIAAAEGHIAATPAPDAPDSAPPAEPALDPTEPTPPDVVGRPPLVDVAQERAATRTTRVIGAPTQEEAR